MFEYQINYQTYYALLMTVSVTLSLIVMLAACLCCKKKIPNNELLGLEGMVKLKNPDEVIVITAVGNSESQADLNLSTISNADSEKRASTAAHRSLPDIPIADANGDTGSELYETVADKRLIDAQNSQNKSPTPSLKKQTSVSQHSSISQADDVSSPYSRVKNSPHDYAKVRSTEHPYAQLNAPSTVTAASSSTLGAANSSQITLNTNDSLNRNSHHSSSSQNLNDSTSQAEIPAASAIAGMISASQDLPYMTPPIANQHFSGDSQDSSKGYTSISVREPLANILAQQPPKPIQRNATMSRDVNDSHYATVSDDSDETYAAIEDPNGRHNLNAAADIYTSGSETYAQIQPMQSNSIVVSVEINNTSASTLSSISQVGPPTNSSQHLDHSIVSNTSSASVTTTAHHHQQHHHGSRPNSTDHPAPIHPPVDSLRAQMHSRQASSSSNNSSSMGNLGSPKPEKRQANSPLPPTPTPKSNTASLHATSSSNLTSGRNSVISVIELSGMEGGNDSVAVTNAASTEGSPQKKKKSISPSKDIEGMYAKVMKKNKFSTTRQSPSSQNNSPIMARKCNDSASSSVLGISALDSAAAELMEVQKIVVSTVTTGDKSRTRSNSYTAAKDHGYETIPADAMRNNAGIENRKSDCLANILQKERQQEGVPSLTKHYETIAVPGGGGSTHNSDPGYETLLKPKSNQSEPESEKKSSDYDPNYEVLKSGGSGLSDDGYAKVLDKKRVAISNDEEDSTDGYSKVKGEDCDDGAIGYSTIGEFKGADANHNYASILETKAAKEHDETHETELDHYARIAESRIATTPDLTLSLASTPSKADDIVLTPRLPEIPLISPSSINSSTMLNNSSAASSTILTTSNSTMSSRQTPTSSQYESLTGSDTDPNYESVCYLNTSRENPYERLQTDNSDTQLSTPITPEERTAAAAPIIEQTHATLVVKSAVANGPKCNSTEPNTDVVVDDYFQV